MKQNFRTYSVVAFGNRVLMAIALMFCVSLQAAESDIGNPSHTIAWNTSRGIFSFGVSLDQPAGPWAKKSGDKESPSGVYQSGTYEITLDEDQLDKDVRIIRWNIQRSDGELFTVGHSQLYVKTSYSGVYKLFMPSTMAQQRYGVDLPFQLDGGAASNHDSPVFWMQQSDGKNTLTMGLLDQQLPTRLQSWTYNFGPDQEVGEAQGLANSYVRLQFTKSGPAEKVKSFTDGVYINANPDVIWHEALSDYSRAVDDARNFQANERAPDVFLNPMWHSWYAHSDKIKEEQIRDDARRSAALGITTIQLDAGWSYPPSEPSHSLAVEGDYVFDPERFPNAREMIDDIHKAGQKVILHVSPLVMGNRTRAYANGMKACLLRAKGRELQYMDPRLVKTHEYLLNCWEFMFKEYDIDGMWYDFLEFPRNVDPPPPGMEILSMDLNEAYTLLMAKLYRKARELKDDAVIILRRGSANHHAKRFCTHVWPMDTPQDYNMNRRDIVYLKTLGKGVLTHACCASWAISESDLNVGRQMASIVLAGVPAFSVKLAESPESHNKIISAWLKFYEQHKRDLVLGQMTPLLPTPPSAAIRIEAEDKAYFGLFEAAPGRLTLTHPVDQVIIVNAYSKWITGRLEGAKGKWNVELFDHSWQSLGSQTITSDENGLTLNLSAPEACFSAVLTRQ